MAGGRDEGNTSGFGQTPSAEIVDSFHTNADTDVRRESIHHTLGPLPTQAAPGNHSHKGGDSELLFTGETVSGSRTDGTAVQSIIQILVAFGATDSSTA
jgi:hypothetical protein